jgi:hypothetical protein
MQKKLVNQYDQDKKLLNKLRQLNESFYAKKRSLTEQVGDTGPSQEQRNTNDTSTFVDNSDPSDKAQEELNNNIMVINDVDVKINSTDKADMKLDDSQKTAISNMIDNFKSQVAQIVDMNPGMSISETQIRLDGVLTDNDIKFVFIAGQDGGVYINAEMLKIDNTVTPILDKLIKFEDTFKSTLEPFIGQRQTN